jgi:iron complex transport system substrate-binding protein
MRKSARSLLALLALLVLCGCGNKARREIIDRAGNRITLSGKVDRLISTAPSNTEIIAELGMADRLVAADKYSQGIPGVPKGLPLIDFFYPDAEAVIGLAPDLIIANGHNQFGSGDDPFKLIREAGITVAYIPMSESIAAIYGDIEFIAEALGVPEKGREVTERMRSHIDAIAAVGRTISDKRTVYFEISPIPSIVSLGRDSYLHEMIETIGAENIFASERGVLFPSAEAIISKNPDVIFTNVNYGDGQGAEDPVEEIKRRTGFEHIAAVKNNRVYQIDADSSSRPSPHILLALNQMAAAVYPERYEKH